MADIERDYYLFLGKSTNNYQKLLVPLNVIKD